MCYRRHPDASQPCNRHRPRPVRSRRVGLPPNRQPSGTRPEAGELLSTTERRQHSWPRRRVTAIRTRVKAFRADIEAKPALRRTYRVAVAVLGGLVLAAGIVMIPYPGPGWAVVFIGLAILASEFTWAHRVLTYARGRYDAWTDWLNRQHLVVRLAVLIATGLIVLATLYLLNVIYPLARLVGLGSWTWLQSPLFG